MSWVTILEVGAEGGGLTLLGQLQPSGIWSFKFFSDESTLMEKGDNSAEFKHESLTVDGWYKAMGLLNSKYPNWFKLYPLAIHPLFRESIMQFINGKDSENQIRLLEDWKMATKSDGKDIYTTDYTKEKLRQALDSQAFDEKPTFVYQADCINWKGRVCDGEKLIFSEVIAKELHNIGLAVEKVKRDTEYLVHTRPVLKELTARAEEHQAIKLFNEQTVFEKLGKIVEYQVPIKGKKTHTAGKVDLISYNATDNQVYLVELKVNGNKDTLLRAILEIQTYYLQLDTEGQRKIESELIAKGIAKGGCTTKTALLLYPGCTSYREYIEINDRPETKKLIEDFGLVILLGAEKSNQ